MTTTRPKKEGFLVKEGGKVKSWKKRWFVLGSLTISYYKNEKSLRKVLGVISLKEVTGATIAPQYKKKSNVLLLQTRRRIYYLVSDIATLESWRDAIKTQVDIAQGRTVLEKLNDENDEKVGVDHFEMLTIIGQGSFGKVVQVRMKSTGDIFAMKVLNKKNILDRGEAEHTRAEKNILQRISHPFLMKLHYSFQTPDKLYLVMDFVNGGELFFHLQNERKFSYERARFYAAEITLGIEHLHKNGIIYRDLKPENLLLDSEGHVRMTDFGLSKEGVEGDQRTNTFCGTPEYLAPEVLDGKDYNKAVDWWSLGTLIFEMLTGLPPFYDEDIQRMYNLKMTAELAIPDYVPAHAQDIIRKFLDRNPKTRLQNPDIIKTHKFFEGIDWDLLLAKEIDPPYKPSVASKESTKMIDKSFLSMDVKKEVTKPSEPVPKTDAFEGFTYQTDGTKKA